MNKRKLVLRGMKYMKRVLGILAALVIFMQGVDALNYVYVDPGNAQQERPMWHDFYGKAGKIDNLYLGSSHVYMDIDPFWLNDANEQCNFDMGTGSQLMNVSYYLLREADRYNELSHVYLELYYNNNIKESSEPNKERIDTKRSNQWGRIDPMRFSFNKLRCMLDLGEMDQYVNICIPFTRYRTEIGDGDYVRDIISKKQDDDYINYQLRIERDNGVTEYWGDGFQYNSFIFMDEWKRFTQQVVLDENPIGEKCEGYLRRIIAYCHKRNIPITLFVSPMPEGHLIALENYDNYVTQVKMIAEECDVDFYDFNLAKEEYLPIQKGEYFKDNNHLNYYGASLFTPFFYEVVSGEAPDNEKYFYDSYAQKLRSTAPALYGIYCRDLEDETSQEARRIIWVASNRETDMEYRIAMTPDEGEPYLVQDYNINKEFTVSKDEGGICSITARMKGRSEVVQTMEIKY